MEFQVTKCCRCHMPAAFLFMLFLLHSKPLHCPAYLGRHSIGTVAHSPQSGGATTPSVLRVLCFCFCWRHCLVVPLKEIHPVALTIMCILTKEHVEALFQKLKERTGHRFRQNSGLPASRTATMFSSDIRWLYCLASLLAIFKKVLQVSVNKQIKEH